MYIIPYLSSIKSLAVQVACHGLEASGPMHKSAVDATTAAVLYINECNACPYNMKVNAIDFIGNMLDFSDSIGSMILHLFILISKWGIQ